MIKILEDLLIEATTNANVPGSLVAGLRKAVETARCGSVKGKTFTFSGVLPTLSRDEACVRIEAAGGVIVSAVSANLDYLVAGSEAGSKLLEALELGVPVIGEKQLQSMLPGVIVPLRRAITPDLMPPPFDSQEEASRAAGIRPQEADPPYRVCIKAHETNVGNTVPVGHVVALESGESLQQPDCWAPCDKDGRVSRRLSGPEGLATEWRGHPGRPQFSFSTGHVDAIPKPSAIDEMAEQMRRWAAPTRDVPDIEVAHFICIAPIDGYAVGDRIRAARDTNPTPDPQVWAPCDAAGWVPGWISWPVGLKVVTDGGAGYHGACRWRPMVQKPTVVTKADSKSTNPKAAAATDRVPLGLLSPIAKAHWALAQHCGRAKYGAWNWREAGVRASDYIDAIGRHTDGYLSGETYDPADGTHHLGNVMACCAILLEAEAAGKLTDDRPPTLDMRPTYADVQRRLADLTTKYADRNPKHWTR